MSSVSERLPPTVSCQPLNYRAKYADNLEMLICRLFFFLKNILKLVKGDSMITE